MFRTLLILAQIRIALIFAGLVAFGSAPSLSLAGSRETIDLSGEWEFRWTPTT